MTIKLKIYFTFVNLDSKMTLSPQILAQASFVVDDPPEPVWYKF